MTSSRERRIYKVTLMGTAVNVVLIILKFVAGAIGRSSAMTADAVHSLTDFVTDVVVIVFVRIAGKPQDAGHDYGHGKFETFASMVIGAVLAAAGVALFWNGLELVIHSLRGNPLPEPRMIALIVAVVSIISKEILYRYTIREARSVKSDALTANAWHHRSDAISSLGTLVGIAGAMFLGDRWRILDPIAAMVVSIFIVKSGYDIIRPSISELMESSLSEEDQKKIKEIAMSVDGVDNVHNLRTRKVGNNVAIDIHTRMNGEMSLRQAHALASEIERRIRRAYGRDTYINIHMEPL